MQESPVMQPAQRARLFGALGWLAFVSSGVAAGVSFDVPSERLWLNEKQVLSFHSDAEKAKRVFETKIDPADAAEILQPGTILDGEKTGFLRIRPLKAGKAILHVGNASLLVDIKADTASEFSRQSTPRIVSPMAGACVYGTITVGVEVPLIVPGTPDPKIQLFAGDTKLQPRAQTLPSTGSNRLFAFDINADQFPAGPVKLQAESVDAAGVKRQSEPVYVAAFRPDQSAILAGACAEHMDGARPQRYGDKWPEVKKDDPAAPEGYLAMHSGKGPAWLLSQNLPDAGYYQMFLRVRGEPGAGSYPSIGLVVDEKNIPDTNVRLVDKAWHRVALGQPIFLDAGEHVLATRHTNPFSAGKDVQRDLYLERYELVRVSKADTNNPGGDPDMMMMEGAAAGGEMMKAGGDKPAIPGVDPVRVAFTTPFDGKIADGPLRVRAQAWWQTGFPTPTVNLLVNGAVVQTQYGADLDFHLPVEALKPGKNILSLHATLPGGIAADSPPQTVTMPALPLDKTSRVPQQLRYGVLAPGWDASMAQRLEKPKPSYIPTNAAFLSNGESSLTLPNDLAGDFAVSLEASGHENNGPPLVQCVLQQDTRIQTIGQAPIPGGPPSSTVKMGQVHLNAGPKELIVRFLNATETPKGAPEGRHWHLKALRLEEVSPAPMHGPTVTVKYSPSKVSSDDGGADVVVARCFAQDGIKWADLVIDGKPQDLQLTPPNGMGPLVFPLLARSLATGSHVVQVMATSQGGKESVSPACHFDVVSTPIPAEENRYARAVHLMNRFGYGPEPDETADILVNGEDAWLRDRLLRTWDDPNEQAVMALLRVRYPDDAQANVVSKALLQLLLTRNPVRARFTLWAENHFSTWIVKDEQETKGPEHQRFLELGVAPFRDLLFASATSPAMLIYLDQFRSYANKLNENYAREIMELHTVGVHGGYNQSDVTSLAAILTGWTLSQDAPLVAGQPKNSREFRYEPMLDSPQARRVFGMEFAAADPAQRYDRTHSALEMLAAHPSAARFISEKLAQHYVGMPAPASLVDHLAKVFVETGGDMTEMLSAIAGSPEFWSTIDKPRMATPFDYSIRLCRMTGMNNPFSVADFLRRSGTGMFDRVTPDGFPETDASYADSNAMVQRWGFAKNLQDQLRALVPQSLAAKQAQWSPAMQEKVIDVAAARLLGRPLSANSYKAAWNYLNSTSASDPDHIHLTTAFLAQLPENNLR